MQTMMRGGRELRAEMCELARALHARGWVANHDGNLTARLGAKRFLATPTATSKGKVAEGKLIEVDDTGKCIGGTVRPFGEIGMHLAIFSRRDDVGAVVHAHPPYATALACSGSRALEQPFIAEAVVSIGPSIPTVPFCPPGPEAAAALAAVADRVDAALLQNHGVFAWGAHLEQAYLRLELVEHLARIATLAQATGGVRPLPASALPALLAARAKAGLGKAAERAASDGGAPIRVAACAPAPHAPDVEVVTPGRSIPPQLSTVIREELLRALRDRD
jgi:L-fuculose-phosphate aldolase